MAATAHAMVIPRQHGAWSVLIASFVVGIAAVGRVGLDGLLALGLVLCGFIAHYAATQYLKLQVSGGRSTRVLAWTIGYVSCSAGFAAVLIIGYERWLLLPFVIALTVIGAVSIRMEFRRESRTVAGELINMAGLSLVVPLVAYASTGVTDLHTAGLWVLCALFFSASVFHVRFLVRRRSQRAGSPSLRLRAGLSSVIFHLAALVVALSMEQASLVPAYSWLVLAPSTLKALVAVAVREDHPVPVRRIGFIEVGHTILFVILVAAVFRLGGH